MNNRKILLSLLLILGVTTLSFSSASVADEFEATLPQESAKVCARIIDVQNPGNACNVAFEAAKNTLCNDDEEAQLQTCSVNQPAAKCTNAQGKSGYECTCHYTCKKKEVKKQEVMK